MNLEGKVAFVSGASSGIGSSICFELAKQGCNVILNYNNNLEGVENVNKDILENFNVLTLIVKGDISKEEDVKNMLDLSLKEFGKVDILVNNAGIANDSLIEDKKVEDFKKVLDINLVGTFLICKYFGKEMYNNKFGKIINISSTNAIDTYYPFSIDYDASKAGVISLTHNFAKYFAPYVNVNCVAPGWVNTPMNKNLDKYFYENEKKKSLLKRFGEPKEVANVVCFLASDLSLYINSEVIRVDGGVDNENK